MKKESNLEGKVSVITGATSGIGRQIAMTFAEHGSKVVIIDIVKGDEVCKLINDKYNTNGFFFKCDVSNYKEVKKTTEAIIKKFQKVDNLICAAGYGSNVPLENMEISEWQKSVDVNLNGSFYIIRYLISNMLENKKGNIILIGSATFRTGSGGGVHYAATKVAQYGLMKGLSYEFLSRGIRTNIITPHLIDTPMLRRRYSNTEENNRILAARVPLGRIGKPSDIANIAEFLVSDRSEYICGAEIFADGGGVYYKH